MEGDTDAVPCTRDGKQPVRTLQKGTRPRQEPGKQVKGTGTKMFAAGPRGLSSSSYFCVLFPLLMEEKDLREG